MAKFCTNCGAELNEAQDICLKCGVKVNKNCGDNSTSNNPNAKSKIVAGLLGIFLGCFGVHNFYLGYTGIGIAQIVVSVLTCIIGGAIWGFIEGLCILCDTAITTDSEGNDLV